MIKLTRPVKENPYLVDRIPEMVPAELSDLKTGATVYLNQTENPNVKVLSEHIIRDRILAARNDYGKAYGQDETLEEFRDYKEFLKIRTRKRAIFIIREK